MQDNNDEPLGGLDRAVASLARGLNALGLNGTRLLWRWNRWRKRLTEVDLGSSVALRSAQTKHKMCPACRSLVGRGAPICPDCGADLAAVSTPGIGRTVSNLLPGITAATSLLMLVNGFWFMMMILAQIKSGGGGGGLFGGFSGEMIVLFGSGLSRPTTLDSGQVVGGEWWRLITPIFLHGGLLHFFLNSYVLMYLGPLAEQMYGTPRFWVIYLTSGIAGSVASEFPRYVNTVGASGAIAGLIGLLLVVGLRSGGVMGQTMKNLVFRLVLYSVILSLVMGGGIDHYAHLGGFVCGALLALIVPSGAMKNRGETRFWQALSLAGVLLVLYGFYQVALQGRLGA